MQWTIGNLMFHINRKQRYVLVGAWKLGMMCALGMMMVLVASGVTAAAQNFPTVIKTVAGGGPPNNVAATGTFLSQPRGAAVDSNGNVFIADTNDDLVRKVDGTGNIATIAGGGGGVIPETCAGSTNSLGDGCAATSASLAGPGGVFVDATGNIFIADTRNGRIRKVDTAGVISTVAGGGLSPTTCAGSTDSVGDGCAATSASLFNPSGVFVDAAGNIFIADSLHHRIRKVNSSGIISTVAGNGGPGFAGDNGPAINANLNDPSGVFVDATGNIFIADTLNHRVREVNTAGTISTIAGDGVASFSGDNGPATSAGLDEPFGVFVDAANNIFIADTLNHRIRKVNSSGVISTVAGNGTPAFAGDNGPATSASLASPCGVFVHAGNILIADKNNSRIRNVDTSATITTMAGNGSNEGDGGPATSALLSRPLAAKPDANGNLLVFDTDHSALREVFGQTPPAGQTAGNIATIADAIVGVSPRGGFVDGLGNIFICNANNVILKISPVNGGPIVVAGGGTSPGTCAGSTNSVGDGCVATSATLSGPSDVAVDSAGNIFIADEGDQRIRKVDHTTLVITTVAGNGGSGFSGDNGPATSANLTFPASVAVDDAGNIYIADTGNSRIRKVNSAGIITTIAGNGTFAFSGDGVPATSAELAGANGLALDGAGDLFIADANGNVSNRIRRIDHTTQIITTIAGNGAPGFSGDNGSASSASLNFVNDVGLDAKGNIFITDTDSNRIREVITFPLGNAQTAGTPANTALNLTLAGASPRGSVPLTFSIASGPGHGTLSNLSPSAGAVTYTSDTTFTGADTFTFVVNDGNVSSSAATVSMRVFDFSLGPAPGAASSATVTAGQTANYTLQLGMVNGASRDQFTVTVNCSGAPAQAICAGPASPVTVAQGTPATVAISVNTTANAQMFPMPHSHTCNPNSSWPVALLATLTLSSWLSLRWRREPCGGRIGWVRLAVVMPALLLLLLLTTLTLSGCGGGGGTPTRTGTPAGTSTLTVKATSGTLVHTTQLTLTVQ